MDGARHPTQWKRFFVRILFPSALAISLFVAFIFGVIVPDVGRNLMERKREMIRELTHSAWSVLKEYEAEERAGRLSGEEARKSAIDRIRGLRYGAEGKDYFWITDMHPRMLMHPFRTDLNGQDVSDFQDPAGNHVFVEFVNVVRERGSGYMDYVWQWKDDPSRLVPKESFVMGFEPWGWVIGTGIYVEDVREEIASLNGRLIRYSLIIAAIVSLILLFVAQQSLRLERQRQQAEAALRESHEKYRALVEAATEGTLMVLDGRCNFANHTLLQMLGYAPEELAALGLFDLLAVEPGDDPARAYLKAVIDGVSAPSQLEARLRRKDGSGMDVVLAASRIQIAEKTGIIVVAKDIGRHKRMEAELGQSREKFYGLLESSDVGVFRTTAGKRGRLLEASAAARRVFGLPDGEDFGGFDVLEAIVDPADREGMVKALASAGGFKERTIQLRRVDGTLRTVAVSAVLTKDESGFPRTCDGVVVDVTERRRVEAERDALIEELQTPLLFLNEPVRTSQRELPACEMGTPIAKAAVAMTRNRFGAILVRTPGGDAVGILTDHDLRERVVATGMDVGLPIQQVMTSPVVSIAETAPIYDALLTMREKGTRHLAVRDAAGRIVSVVRHQDLLEFHRYSSAMLAHEIRRAGSPAEVATARARLPVLVKTLSDWGARPRTVTRVISAVSDAVVERLVGLAVEDLGPPPARFAFLALGSEGREEQTLATDQDNAILFEDTAPEALAAVTEYFCRLGSRVCDGLQQAGYAYCEGEMMASNPRWVQPLSKWKDYFGQWIHASSPQDLLQVNMFFDFRAVVGEASLAVDLRRRIESTLREHPPFFLHFAQNALLYKPPIGMFGKIVTDSGGDNPRTFSVKEAMMPMVNFARLYALKNGVGETNTLVRLLRLFDLGVLTRSSYEEVSGAYEHLMEIRLRHQARAVGDGQRPGNHVNPRDLSEMDEAVLKKALGQVSLVLKKISFDFLGQA